MPIGNPVTLTSNVASKAISVTATASQTLFNVTGGYRINELGVFKNGLRLQDGVDYTARDGLTVTLLSAASGGDKLQFVVFDTFRVAEAIRPAVDEQTIRGNLNVVGILSCTDLEGPVSLNITSGIQTFHDVRVGGALTVAGTLTYEDTTNTNTTGIATFSGGMNISGVGATATTLNVTGFSTFSDNVSIGDSIFHTGDIDTSIRFPAADTFTVETAGSERLRVTSGGKLATNGASSIDCADGGIHLYLGDGARDDYSTSADGLIIEKNGTTGLSIDPGSSGTANIYFPNESNHSIAQISHNNSTGEFRIRGEDHIILSTNNNTERLRVTSAGNIGIGTTIPQDTLDVANAVPQIRLTDLSDGSYGQIRANGGNLILRADEGNSIGDSIINFEVDGGEKVRITSAGQIGIGTDSPLDLLHITSASGDARVVIQGTVDSDSEVKFYEGGTNRYTIGHDAATGEFRIGGSNVDSSIKFKINAAGDATFSGVTTATQLFEGSTRVATTGKAIAMAMLFG